MPGISARHYAQDDIVTCGHRRGTGIFLLALPPSVTAVRTAGSLLRRHVLMAPVRLPFFSATLECQVLQTSL